MKHDAVEFISGVDCIEMAIIFKNNLLLPLKSLFHALEREHTY